ncbi:Cna B-type domain-containing protein [uncultured Ruminococcus sp.]|uniref:Cna B-type domain-containing protein n=1 Tax=uncultured Ruminococcus sp. TaxID=165186 RepID=UPI0026775075|nr:Cna B-type domain-containing protein [uncultured Ruminococcus sp.]
MLNFNQRVQQFLKQHRENKKHAVIAVMLALMVAFSVCGSLIMPAVSMTGSTEETAPALEMAESEVQMVGENSNEWFTEPVTEIPAGAQPMTAEENAGIRITNVNIKHEGQEVDAPYEISVTEDSTKLEVQLNYNLKAGSVTEENPYIYYQLTDKVVVSPESGEDCKVKDGNELAGYYSISQSGLIVIRLTKEYINKHANSDMTGFIRFDGTINRDNTSSGDQEVTIGGITIKVDFPEKEVEIKKSGTIQNAKTPTDNPKIQWTITVDNPYYNDTDSSKSMNGYVLTDEQFPEDTSGVTVTPAGVGSFQGKTFTFNDTKEKQITFTFEKEVSREEWLTHVQNGQKIENTATIAKDGVQKGAKGEVSLSKPTIQKNGKADYETGISDDKVNWNITVEEPAGCSLNGWKVKDEAFSSLEANQITLKDENGNTVGFSKDGDTITISSDAKKVEVSYQMKLDPTQPKPQKLKNRAYLLYPDGNTAGDTGEIPVDYKKLYTLVKKGVGYDRAANKLKWTANVGCSDGNNKRVTLNGYELTDAALKNVSLKDLTISGATFTWVNCIVLNESTIEADGEIRLGTREWNGTIKLYATITKDGDKLIFKDAVPYDGTNENGVLGLHNISISYETDAATAGTDGTAKNGDTVTNTVSDNKGNSSSSSIDVGNRDQITKTFVKAEGGDAFYNADDPSKNNQTLRWKINVTSDTGFSSDSKVLVDVMTAEGTGASHYFTIGTNSISVKAKTESGEYEQLTLGTDYQITYYSTDSQEETKKITAGNAKCFAITFTKTVDDKAYRFAEIEYSTMADVSGVKMDGKTAVSSKFSNTASFGTLNPSTPSYDLIEKSKDTVEKQTLTVNKTYSDGNTDKKPSVTFQLQRKKQGTNATDWTQIYLVDGEWTEVTADESNPYTFTLDSSNGWKQTFSDLPKDTLAHDGDYLYRVVETPVDGYTVSYSDSQNGVESGSITITNNPKQDFKKAALDADGNVLADGDSIALSDLPTLTVGDTTYYLIQWKIYDIVKNYKYELEDTLPENSILIESDAEDNKYKPHASWNEWYIGVLSTSTSGSEYYQYDSSTRKLTIYMNNAGNPPLYVTYYTGIPVETLKSAVSAGTDGYTVTNTIAQKGSDAKTASVKVTGSTADTSDKNLLTKNIASSNKNGAYTAEDGQLNYSVYVNPDGKYLSNSGEIDLTDDLTLDSYEGASAAGIDAVLSMVKVEKIENPVVDASGAVTDATVVRELSTSEYQYLVEHNIKEETPSKRSDLYQFTTSDNKKWTTNQPYVSTSPEFPKGDIVTIRLKGEPNHSLSSGITVYGKCVNNSFGGEIVKYPFAGVTFDENGYADITFKIEIDYVINWVISLDASDSSDTFSVDSVKAVQVKEIDSRLKLTVPDGEPLKVTYQYTLLKDGKPVTPESLSETKTVISSNSISLDTGNASAGDQKDSIKFSISKSRAGISAENKPQIVKYDVGDYSLKLDATFQIAKYQDGKWLFASKDELVTNDKLQTHKLTYDAENQSSAVSISVKADEDYKLDSFDKATLYKIVETKAPDGYEALTASNSTYYFVYGSEALSSYPDGVTADDVIQVQEGGSVNIPNNQLIDLTVQKTWTGLEDTSGTSIKAALYWSYTKTSSGFPENMELASAENLGISGLENPKEFSTAAVGSGENPQNPSYTWKNLPSGKNGKPIYYYVKEAEYTYGGKTYIQQTDGTFQASDGTSGTYRPNTTGNAANKDGTISINNSQGLVVEKLWRDSDGNPIPSSGIPATEVQFQLEGLNASGTWEKIALKENALLTAENGWKLTLESYLADGVSLEAYTKFRVSETGVKKKGEDKFQSPNQGLYGWIISATGTTNGTTGTLILTNRNNEPTEIAVSVEKIWGDGAEQHTGDSVEVKLYQSTTVWSDIGTPPSDAQVYQSSGTQTLNQSNSWTYTWSDLPYKTQDGSRYYYYVVESSVPEGYQVKYDRTERASEQKTTITNYKPGSLTVCKKWEDDKGQDISAGITTTIALDLYKRPLTTTTTTTDSSTETPEENTKIMAMGDSITEGYGGFAGSYRKYLYYQLKKQYGYSIDMVGMPEWQIPTYDFGDGSGAIAYDDGYVGTQGLTIAQLQEGIQDTKDAKYKNIVQEKQPDIVLLLIGANDIMNDSMTYRQEILPVETYESRYKSLIDEIYRQCASTAVYVMTPTPIDSSQAEWLADSYVQSNLKNAVEAVQNVVAYYTANQKNCKCIDTNAYLKKQSDFSYLNDYCHPNEKGHKLIGDYVAEYLVENYFKGTVIKPDEPDAPDPIDGLPDDFYNSDGSVNQLYSLDRTITLGNGSWSTTFTDLEKGYLYYVVEKSASGWNVSYTSNGQILGTSGATITVTNTKTIEKTSISVEKKWVDEAGASHDAVRVTLRRKLESGTDYDKGFSETAELSSSNGWTHTWSSLDKTDAGGNQYLYDVVEENVPGGYQATYKNNNGVNGNTAENPIVIVNTKVLQLTLKKRWSDSDTNKHWNDRVDVNIYRSTNPADVPIVTTATTKATTTTTTKATATETTTKATTTKATTTETTTKATTTTTTTTTTTSAEETKPEETTTTTQPKLKLTAADNKTELLEKGGKLQLTADPSDGVTFKSSSDKIATVDSSSGLVTGKEAGTVTITAHKDGYEDATIQLTVKDATKRVDVSNAAAGKTFKFTVTGGKPGENARVGCVYHSTVVPDTENHGYVTVDCSMDGDNKQRQYDANGNLEVEFTVPDDFDVSQDLQFQVWWAGEGYPPVEKVQVTYTAVQVTTTTTTTKPEETTTTTTTDGGSSGESTETGTLFFETKGTKEIVFDDERIVESIRVKIISATGSNMSIQLQDNSGNTVSYCNAYWWNLTDSLNASGEGVIVDKENGVFQLNVSKSVKKITFMGNNPGTSFSYTITYATDTSAQSLAAPSAMRMLRMAANVMTSGSAEKEQVGESITLKGSDSSNWQAVLTNLPAYDENGNPYYYWAEETTVGGYTPSYTYAGGADNYISGADGVITITNTKEESASVTMPATGGRGTRWYTITGAAILCGTAAGYLWFRRRYLSRVE